MTLSRQLLLQHLASLATVQTHEAPQLRYEFHEPSESALRTVGTKTPETLELLTGQFQAGDDLHENIIAKWKLLIWELKQSAVRMEEQYLVHWTDKIGSGAEDVRVI